MSGTSPEEIYRRVQELRRRYGRTDPVRLCEAMGILLLYAPMGTGRDACKGFYLTQSRKRAVTVNSDLPEPLQRVILAHELGHAMLHRREAGVHGFRELRLFDETDRLEYEANLFAAELLLEDGEVLSLMEGEMSFFGTAAALEVPPELLDYKFRALLRRGCQIGSPPLGARSDFLRRI